MKIVIAAETEYVFHTLSENNITNDHQFIWVTSVSNFTEYPKADVFIDLIGGALDYRSINGPLLINNTTHTLGEMQLNDNPVARFCAWPGFLERKAWEVAVTSQSVNDKWNEIMSALGKEFIIVADTPGFIAPRILSTIINEACYALDEGISDAEQVDKAMKLGTNYPEGPVAWGKKIGFKPILRLLEALSVQDFRYQPHHKLKEYLS